MIRTAIVEDDAKCRELLKEYLLRYGREEGYDFDIRMFTNGDGITQRYEADYDLILMDVEMPLVGGLEAARMIREQDSEVIIIFITNMMQYAIKGYAVDALDYVIKPVSYFAFSQYVGRALTRMQKRKENYLLVSVKGGVQKLNVTDIFYIENRNHEQIFHTVQMTYRSFGKLGDLEEKLRPYYFFRCHTGYLLNLMYVEGYREGNAVVRGELVPVSRYRKKEFLEALADYIDDVRK